MNKQLIKLKEQSMMVTHGFGAFGEHEKYNELDEEAFAENIVIAVLGAIADERFELPDSVIAAVLTKFGIDYDQAD